MTEEKSWRESTISPEISLRITIIRFPLIVGVVMGHSYGVLVKYSDHVIGNSKVSWFAIFIQVLISKVIAPTVIPLFFLMAGFLFFYNFKLEWRTLFKKYRTRFHSLFIPYLFWNTATLGFYFIITSIPILSNYVDGTGMNKFIANYTFVNYVDAFVGFKGYPIAYQFWFIRELIILVILSPLISLIAKRRSSLFLLIIAGCWFMNYSISTPILRFSSVLFFYVGALIAIKKYAINWVDTYGGKILIIYCFCAVTEAVIVIFSGNNPILPYLDKFNLLLGTISAWYLTGRVANHASANKISKLSVYSFFVYAAHEPFLRGIRKIAYSALDPSNAISITFLYFICPIMTISIMLLAAFYLRTYYPRIYKVINGGRA